MLLLLLIWVGFGIVAGAVWQSKGGSFGAGFLIGGILGIFGLIIVALAKPSGANVAAPGSIAWTHSGPRFLLGYIVDPPCYGVWDRQAPGPPVERFPYNEHGKAEALARFNTLEPNAEVVGLSLPPVPSPS
jgi:hypothetical protein